MLPRHAQEKSDAVHAVAEIHHHSACPDHSDRHIHYWACPDHSDRHIPHRYSVPQARSAVELIVPDGLGLDKSVGQVLEHLDADHSERPDEASEPPAQPSVAWSAVDEVVLKCRPEAERSDAQQAALPAAVSFLDPAGARFADDVHRPIAHPAVEVAAAPVRPDSLAESGDGAFVAAAADAVLPVLPMAACQLPEGAEF